MMKHVSFRPICIVGLAEKREQMLHRNIWRISICKLRLMSFLNSNYHHNKEQFLFNLLFNGRFFFLHQSGGWHVENLQGSKQTGRFLGILKWTAYCEKILHLAKPRDGSQGGHGLKVLRISAGAVKTPSLTKWGSAGFHLSSGVGRRPGSCDRFTFLSLHSTTGWQWIINGAHGTPIPSGSGIKWWRLPSKGQRCQSLIFRQDMMMEALCNANHNSPWICSKR